MRVTKPQGRIAIGYAMVNDKRVPVTIDVEWDKYLLFLTNQSNGYEGSALVGAQGVAGASVMLDGGEGGGDVEFVPGPRGPQGERGEPGPALWMLEDPQETEVFWKVS